MAAAEPTQSVIWTVLPQQGFTNVSALPTAPPDGAGKGDTGGRPSLTGHPQRFSVNLSVLVSPRLTTNGVTDVLSGFPDWANWPTTLLTGNNGGPIGFSVTFGNYESVFVVPDLSGLRPDLWDAVFGSDPSGGTTAVSDYAYQDWSQSNPVINVNTFSVLQAHTQIKLLYSNYGAGLQPAAAGGADKPDISPLITGSTGGTGSGNKAVTGPSKLSIVNGEIVTSSSDVVTQAYVALQSATSAGPVANALAFRRPAELFDIEAPGNPGTGPLDFHQAVSALLTLPQILQLFGLVIPLTVDLPVGLTFPQTLEVTAQPEWNPQTAPSGSLGSTDVCLPTYCSVTNGGFSAAPLGSDYGNGYLDLADSTRFSIIDYDLDGASQQLNASSSSLGLAADSLTDASSGELEFSLPSLSTLGMALVWGGLGSAGTAPGAGLNSFTARQTFLNGTIQGYIDGSVSSLFGLHADDLVSGYRIDVRDAGLSSRWRSLHWRLGTYYFGNAAGWANPDPTDPLSVTAPPDGTPSITALDEGRVSLTATEPGATPSDPNTADEINLLVHEAFARWDGWSLATPRPGNQVNDDGTVGGQQPNQPSTAADGSAVMPQLSAHFTQAPSSERQPLGILGLPTLRFGHQYQFAARSVDLSGWSIPTSTTSGTLSSATEPVTHLRYEPISPPLVLPANPFVAGESSLTVVIAWDGINPPQANYRWLFPPQVSEMTAEEHGMFDGGSHAPGSGSYSTIAGQADGIVESIEGIEFATTPTGINAPYLPVADPSGPAAVQSPWLPDPAAAGFSITTLAPSGTLLSWIPPNADYYHGFPNPWYEGTVGFNPWGGGTASKAQIEGVIVNLWPNSWPQIPAALLEFQPVPPQDFNPLTATYPLNVNSSLNGDATAPTTTYSFTCWPGAVYQLELTSTPQPYVPYTPTASPLPPAWSEIFAQYLWSQQQKAEMEQKLPNGTYIDIVPDPQLATAFGQNYLLDPPFTITVVYAVLQPLVTPAFSSAVYATRLPNDTLATVYDQNFAFDPHSTRVLDVEAAWTDTIDDITQSEPYALGHVQHAAQEHAAQVDPLVSDAQPTLPQPTGVRTGVPFSDNHVFNQRFGDTKHHEVTYTLTATSRYPEFFLQSGTFAMTDVAPGLVVDPYSRDLDPNFVSVDFEGHPIYPGDYTVSGPYILANPDAIITFEDSLGLIVQLPLNGLSVTVNWVPSASVQNTPPALNVPSGALPPALKVAKVVPSWSLDVSGQVSASGATAHRGGNALRIYLERPWYETGNGEMLGVVGLPGATIDQSPDLPAGIDPSWVSTYVLDPISVGSRNHGHYVADLNFLGTSGPAVELPTLEDPSRSYRIWPYTPVFAGANEVGGIGLWYVDVLYSVGSAPPPPGYFLRLALVRFQPSSLTGYELSPISLTTYTQPVVNRAVSVTQLRPNLVRVSVSGPAYYGFRPVPADYAGATTLTDQSNEYATHPFSGGGGSESTSTMIAEVQVAPGSGEFSGDFGWTTSSSRERLAPEFLGNGGVTWTGLLELPSPVGSATMRLRISELDYYLWDDLGMPETVDTSLRRSFVAFLPID